MIENVTPDFDLYEVLGVPREAAHKAIHAAYRLKAKHCHPDVAPGDKEAAALFARLQLAHAVLTDPAKRKAYDRTGRCDAPGPDTLDADAMTLIAGSLAQAVKADFDLDGFDVRKSMLKHLRLSGDIYADQLKDTQRQIKRAMRLIKSFVRKNGAENMLTPLLEHQAEQLAGREAKQKDAVRIHERALAILADYDFTVEGKAAPADPFGNFTPKDIDDIARRLGVSTAGYMFGKPPPGGGFYGGSGT